MPPTRILVTGSRGLLGTSLVPAWRASGLDVITHSRRPGADLTGDLATPEAAAACLAVAPDAILHLAACTDVDRCEREPGVAYRENALPVQRLADAIGAAPGGPRLILISTDQVYDGPGPHLEDTVSPLNSYAYSKLLGEAYAARVGATIVRTNFVGPSAASHRTSLTDWLVQTARAGQPITAFDDVRFSPLSMSTLIAVLRTIAQRPVPGVFNLGAHQGWSKAEFALALLTAAGISTATVTRGRSTDRPMAARRPTDMTMDCARAERTFGLTLPTLADETRALGAEYASSAL